MTTVKKKNQDEKQRKFLKWFWGLIIAPFALIFLFLLLIVIGAFGKLPSFEELENPKSNLATEIISEDGELLGSFFVENRSFVDYQDMSPYLTHALVSTEDKRYYSHSGIDFIGLTRVAFKTVLLQQEQGGGSTISQQLAKNLYPRDTVRSGAIVRKGKLFVSKLKEWITAVMLEHNYTKEEIISMYLNIVEYGSNAYGIKSAAKTFFNKTPDQLTMEESALLVGVVNAPSRYSPKRNPERATIRRNLVLSRMRDRGFISSHVYDSVKLLPITLDYRPVSHNEGSGTYFRDMIKRTMTAERPKRNQYANEWDWEQAVKTWDTNPLYGWIYKNAKSDGTPYNLYRDGIRIYTTLNSKMQRYAEDAVIKQLKDVIQPRLDANVKARKRLFSNVSKQEEEAILRSAMKRSNRYRNLKNSGMSEDEIVKNFNEKCDMTIFSYKGDIDTVMTPMDSILYYKQILRASFMAMDPSTGYVKAYVGGPSFRYFKYDMVKQGQRQVGSTIKPFIYTFAIDQLGFTPCTQVPNHQVSIETPNGDAWTPKEAGTVEYDGALHPLSWGLALSRNNYSTWIMKQAKQPQAVADFIHRLGIKSYIDPVYALCLGSADFSLYEMVGAYSTFANRGVYSEPMFVTRIEDRYGNILATFNSESNEAISEQTAYTMLGMLQKVISSGTGNKLKWAYNVTGEVGGKTGTTQSNADAWFMCVAPHVVAGAWVGGEDRSVHLSSGGEGSIVALPIVGEFLKSVYANPQLGVTVNDKFPEPVGVIRYDCDESSDSSEGSRGPDEFFN